MSLQLIISDIVGSFRAVAGTISIRRDNSRIDTVGAVASFVATRAAFVAQKTLYGYLKARIGTRYPRMFEDDIFVQSIDIAKYHVFAACLSDLAIYAAAHALDSKPIDNAARRDLALRCFRCGLNDNSDDVPSRFSADEAVQQFTERADATAWTGRALHRDNFDVSPAALLRWAPIAPDLKKDDAEIVENSIKFAWRDIREQYQKRLDGDAVSNDLSKFALGLSVKKSEG